jgi:hypothetical protein
MDSGTSYELSRSPSRISMYPGLHERSDHIERSSRQDRTRAKIGDDKIGWPTLVLQPRMAKMLNTSTAMAAGYIRSGGSSWDSLRMLTLQRLSAFTPEQLEREPSLSQGCQGAPYKESILKARP